ncbi:MAG TPA: tRNA lysidine(34) synthetase TilS [Acidimicrobiales bacterium]|nr:tRNA lysidine(34) synthetase TilS [Acidimicrobiales bacterium]
MTNADQLLAACTFPPAPSAVNLAVSGGPDSMGLLLLALLAGLEVTVHHVDHHARDDSGQDADFVADYCARAGLAFVRHDVAVEAGANFEARARAARRATLPAEALTGHTMDDLAETMVLNLLRGAGVDGLSPMVGDPTKPLTGLRRGDLHDFVAESGILARQDPTNLSSDFRRNRVRHELLALMNDVAQRDVVAILARSARVIHDDRRWLDEIAAPDAARALASIDCRELMTWPQARLRRWLRFHLTHDDGLGDDHPPSADEVERATEVVFGRARATELSGGRRLARSEQHLRLEGDSTTLTSHG